MKHNKTPGLDGFPAEFYKIFWKELQTFILRALNESYQKGILPPSFRQTVISCLPKGIKPRDDLKNWRPISLTSVLYKMATSTIASRLKKVLPDLISNCQTGFIKGRFIGESTRLVYDIMNYTEKKQKTGLLMLIDFEKAFDSISWKFLYKVLNHYNFSSEFIKWINIFNTEITATVLQVGFLSDFFPIKRGCKQGDPIAPYLFIICAQILCEMILTNKNIKGIKIGSDEFKISQFADDTTLFMDGSESSLQYTLNVLEIFGSLSGLKMNLSKTRMLWIGKKKGCKEKINCGRLLNWDSNNFSLLGITFDLNLSNIPLINYNNAIIKIENTIGSWKKRSLTPLGKITVIKSLILSQLNHLFMSIPLPGKGFCENLNKKLYNFVWDDKPEKIKRVILSQNKVNGGLKMPNIVNFIDALKCTWIRRILVSPNRPWVRLFESSYCSLNDLINYGPRWGIKVKDNIQNDFWKEIFLTWNNVYKTCQLKTESDIFNTPLWFNSKLSNSNLVKNNWNNQGISVIGHIVDSNFQILKKEDIESKYNFRINNFLDYFQLHSTVKKFISQNSALVTERSFFSQPFIPHHISILLNCKHGCKGIYNMINVQEVENKYKMKWNKDLKLNIDNLTWKSIFKQIFYNIQDNSLIWFQYRLIHRILGTKDLLRKMQLEDSNICRICQRETESLMHLFVHCSHVVNLWSSLELLIYSSTCKRLVFSQEDIILGYLYNDNNYYPVNTIIAVSDSACHKELYFLKCSPWGHPKHQCFEAQTSETI